MSASETVPLYKPIPGLTTPAYTGPVIVAVYSPSFPSSISPFLLNSAISVEFLLQGILLSQAAIYFWFGKSNDSWSFKAFVGLVVLLGT